MSEVTYTRTVCYDAGHQVRAVELWEVLDNFVQVTTWMEWTARCTARPGTKGGHTTKRTETVVTDVHLEEGRAIVDIMVRARVRAGYTDATTPMGVTHKT
jgi:hypothetical protein